MAKITQVKATGRTGRRFKCLKPFTFEREGQVVADYAPDMIYYETTNVVIEGKTIIGNKGVVKQNEDKIQWL